MASVVDEVQRSQTYSEHHGNGAPNSMPLENRHFRTRLTPVKEAHRSYTREYKLRVCSSLQDKNLLSAIVKEYHFSP